MKDSICDKCKQTIGFEIKYLRLFEKINEKIEELEMPVFHPVRQGRINLLKSLLEDEK